MFCETWNTQKSHIFFLFNLDLRWTHLSHGTSSKKFSSPRCPSHTSSTWKGSALEKSAKKTFRCRKFSHNRPRVSWQCKREIRSPWLRGASVPAPMGPPWKFLTKCHSHSGIPNRHRDQTRHISSARTLLRWTRPLTEQLRTSRTISSTQSSHLWATYYSAQGRAPIPRMVLHREAPTRSRVRMSLWRRSIAPTCSRRDNLSRPCCLTHNVDVRPGVLPLTQLTSPTELETSRARGPKSG